MAKSVSTKSALFPVIHILSPSSAASHIFRERLAGLFDWRFVEDNKTSVTDDNDGLWNQVFGKSGGLFAPQWNSIGLQCPKTQTMIHFMSIESRSNFPKSPHALLGVQAAHSLDEAKNSLAAALQSTKSSSQIALRSSVVGQPILASHLLGRQCMPVLGFGQEQNDDNADGMSSSSSPPNSPNLHNQTLKEVCLPFFFEATDNNGHSIVEQLGQSHMNRPASGLYQYPSANLCLRPIPAAFEDQFLSPPSFVFHCNSLAEWEENLGNESIRVAKVGWSGAKTGQLVMRHEDCLGIDIRLCENESHSPMFAEAQESLLAGSLPELQSSHVLDGAKGTADPKTEKMDCWAEFRATVKNPIGFLRSQERRETKTAKAPDIPYE